MQTIEQLRKSVMTERIRMSQVRKAFGAGLENPAVAGSPAMAFYASCLEYLNAALTRLHAQDQKIIAILSPLVPEDATDDRSILSEFQVGLDAIEVALNRLMQSLARYQQSEGKEQTFFEQEAHAFLDVFINVLAKRRHTSSHLEENHFDQNHWLAVAHVSDEAKQREQEMFAAVKQSAPPGADPDQFRAGPPS